MSSVEKLTSSLSMNNDLPLWGFKNHLFAKKGARVNFLTA